MRSTRQFGVWRPVWLDDAQDAMTPTTPMRSPSSPQSSASSASGGAPRHLLEVDDLSLAEMEQVLEMSKQTPPPVLAGRGVALLFEKPSLRTRNSAEMAVVALGGHPVSITKEEVALGGRESPEDAARTLSLYHAVIAARVHEHETLLRLASAAEVPVVNLLSDRSHPLQALADVLTLQERWGDLAGRKLAYVGDANNVARSLVLAAGRLGLEVSVASPPGYSFSQDDLGCFRRQGAAVSQSSDPYDAVAGADAVYTDVWVSMGQEAESERRKADFAGFVVDEALMTVAGPETVFLHCLPAHRGLEVTSEVIDGPRSCVWQQAANRLHAARGLLWWLIAAVSPEAG